DRGAGHAFHQPFAQVAALVRRVHHRLAVAAQRPVLETMKRDAILLALLAAGAALLPALVGEFALSLAMACLMYVALASSWSVFCGSTRYLSLATSAFFGIGAYASALLLGTLP